MNKRLDTQHTISTPEGIDLSVRPAGPLVRGLALAVDTVIEWLITLAVFWLFYTLGDFGQGLILVTYFLISWFYPVYFEIAKQGSTPGKKYFNIRVINNDGTPVGISQSVMRNLLRVVDSFPLFYLTGLVTMLISEHYCRLGDLAAATLVVYNKDEKSKPHWPTTQSQSISIPLTVEEQRALLNFAERSQELSKDRSLELANMIAPIAQQKNEPIVQQLYQMARGLLGQ